MKLPFQVPVMGALIVVKGLNLETFPLPHPCTPDVSRFNQADKRLLVNRAVKRKRFQGKKSCQPVITGGFTAILYAVVIMYRGMCVFHK